MLLKTNLVRHLNNSVLDSTFSGATVSIISRRGTGDKSAEGVGGGETHEGVCDGVDCAEVVVGVDGVLCSFSFAISGDGEVFLAFLGLLVVGVAGVSSSMIGFSMPARVAAFLSLEKSIFFTCFISSFDFFSRASACSSMKRDCCIANEELCIMLCLHTGSVLYILQFAYMRVRSAWNSLLLEYLDGGMSLLCTSLVKATYSP